MTNKSSGLATETLDFETAFDAMPGSFVILKPDAPYYTILAVTDEWVRVTGKERQTAIGKSIFDVFPENPQAITATGPSNLRVSLQNAASTKKPDQMPVVRYDVPDGNGVFKERYWSANCKPVLDKRGDVLYILHATADVTAEMMVQKRQSALSEMETAYHLFIQAPVAVCIVKGPDYIVELANESMLQFLGRTPEITGKPILESLPEAKLQGLISIMDRVRKTGEAFFTSNFPATILINGIREQRYFDLTFKPYYAPGEKEVTHVFCVAHNVTEQVLARQKVEEVKDRLNFRNALFEAQNEVTPDGVLIVDANGKMLLHNRRFAEIWNMPREIIESRDDRAALAHAMTQLVNPQKFVEDVTKLYAERKQPSRDQVLFKDGRVIERDGTPIVAENGLYYGWAWYFRDVTDRIKQEQKFRNVVEQATDMIVIYKGEDLVVEVANESLLKLWQVGPEILNKPFVEIKPEMQEQGFIETLRKVLHTGQPVSGYETPAFFKRAGGEDEIKYFNFTLQPYREADGTITGVLNIASDVTEQVATRQQLVESEARYRTLIEEAPVATALYIGKDIRIQYANSIMLSYWNRDKSVIGKTFREALPELNDQPFAGLLEKVYATGEPYIATRERANIMVDGQRRSFYFNFTYKPLRNKEGEIYGIHHTAVDVTKEVEARKKIEESESRLRNLVQQAPVAMLLTRGEDVVIETINAPMLRMMGKREDEAVIGKKMVDVLPEIKDQPVFQAVKNVVTTGQPFNGNEVPITLRGDDGLEMGYYKVSYTPLVEEGRVTGVLHVSIDVTAQVLARRKIEESEQQVRSFIESAPYPIGVYIGKEMRIQFANQAILNAWGKGNDVIGSLFADLLPELDNQEVFKQLQEVFATGIPYHAKNQALDLLVDGKLQTYYYNYSFTPLFNAEGKVYGVMNTGADVTDLNIAHRKIEESERNLRNIILQAPVAMCIFRGPAYVVEIANERMFTLLGKPGEVILNKPFFEAIPEVSDQGFEALLAKVYNSGETYTAYGVPVTLPRDGKIEIVYVNFVYEAFREGDGTISGIMIVATDVTAQVLANKKVEEAEERARLAIQSAELGTYEINLATNEIIASARMAAIFDVQDASDRSGYITAIHPADLKLRADAYEIAYKTGNLEYVGRVIHRDASVCWVRVKGRVYYDDQNNPFRLLGVVQDITEQKEFSEALRKKVEERTRELAEANEHLGFVNKELEQFTYAASHDMQEPLRKVQTFSAFLLQNHTAQLDERGKNYVTKISNSVRRMQTIIDDLLNYSYQVREAQEFVPTDLNTVIEEIEADLEIVIHEKEAVISKDVLPVVTAVPAQMNQLFLNLFTNALKFSKPGFPVKVDIRTSLPSATELSIRGADSGQSYTKISFSDNGIGFKQEYAEQIFSLFKRLHGKSEYEGTGIGLGLCKKIVQHHKGVIWAEAELGKGATFYMLLPTDLAGKR